MIITPEIAQELGLTDNQVKELNKMLSFINVKSITELTAMLNPVDGFFPFEGPDGKLYKVPINTFYQLIGGMAKPISPADPAPIVAGWYKPRVYSAAPGTNYPNLGNLKAVQGFDTLFYFDGNSWVDIANKYDINSIVSNVKTSTVGLVDTYTITYTNGTTFTYQVTNGKDSPMNIRRWEDLQPNDFPLTEGNQVVTDEGYYIVPVGKTAEASDVPGVSDKWVSLGGSKDVETVLKYFLDLNEPSKITMNNNTAKVLRTDGAYLDNPNSHLQEIVIPTGIEKVKFTGYRVGVGDVTLYATMMAKKEDGSFEVLIPAKDGFAAQEIETFDVNLPFGTVLIIVCWNSYQVSAGSLPDVYLATDAVILKEDAVKNYIDAGFETIDYFIKNNVKVEEEKLISMSAGVLNVLRADNTVEVDTTNKALRNIDVEEFNILEFDGYPTISYAPNVDIYSTIVGVKADNSITVLRKSNPSNFSPSEPQQKINISFDVSDFKTVSIGWSNFGETVGLFPTVKVQKTSELTSKLDAVKNYIDNNTPKENNVFSAKASIMLPEANYNINIIGDLPTDITPERTSTDVILDFKLGERTIVSVNTSMEIQGQASVNWIKKNYSIDFKNAFGEKLVIAFGDRVSTDGYVLKSQYADTSKIAEQVGCNIWHDVRTSGDFPENRIDNQPIDTALNAKEEIINEEGAKFFTYGFPVNMYHNGVFFGVYIFRLKKGRNNYRFVNSNKKHIFLDFDYTLPGNAGMSEMLNFNEFKPYQWELRSPKITGYVAGGVISDALVQTPITNLWAWTSAIYNNTLVNVSDHLAVANLNAWIDYYLTCELIVHFDGLDNNILMGSWDGIHFSPLLYDCDGIFGMGAEILNISGKIVNNGNVRPIGRQFWGRFGSYYSVQIKARYLFLKNAGVLSMKNFQKIVQDQGSKMTSEVIKADNTKWGYLDVVKKSPQSILIFLKNRLSYLDTQFL